MIYTQRKEEWHHVTKKKSGKSRYIYDLHSIKNEGEKVKAVFVGSFVLRVSTFH